MKNNLNLLNISDSINRFGHKIETFLNDNYQNPLLWIAICVVLFGLAAWAINYFNKR